MIAIVTGARQGIGRAIAEKFSKNLASTIRIDLINDNGCHQLDVTDLPACQKFVDDICDEISNDDIVLVNNVGKMYTGKIIDTDAKSLNMQMKEAFNVNCISSLNILKPLLDAGISISSVTNISSNSGLQGFSGMSSYCASKFALIGLTQVMAKELAKLNPDCNVNAICPTPLYGSESEMSTNQVEQFMETLKMEKSDVEKMLVSRIPQGKLCTADDVANLTYYLATDGKYITGQAISLTGGMIMR